MTLACDEHEGTDFCERRLRPPTDWLIMSNEFTFHVTTTRFDADYAPSADSRITTNFANLARGEHREQNLRNALAMIDGRLNDLIREDNPSRDRYAVELDIVSASVQFTAVGEDRVFPLLEVLDVVIVDTATGERHQGIVGTTCSSSVRDYDFSIVRPAATAAAGRFTVPEDFGALHGLLFDAFLESDAYRERFTQAPVVCISVSTSRTYSRTGYQHPVLGFEYEQDAYSLTDEYFGRMGLQVRYFMPHGSVAPLAFYFRGDLVGDHTDLQLAGTIATMETFQKIYRPEIYNADTPAGEVFQPSLDHTDFERTPVDYDRIERSQLATIQGQYTREHFIEPHRDVLDRWAADQLVSTR